MTNIKIHTTLLALLTLFALTVCNVAWGAAAQRHRIVFVSDGLKFPGGENAMMEWIDAHLIRPTDANGDIVKGKVAVRFKVDSEGNVHHPTDFNATDNRLAYCAQLVVYSMPQWHLGGKSANGGSGTLEIVFDNPPEGTQMSPTANDTTVYDGKGVSSVPSWCYKRQEMRTYFESCLKEIDKVREYGYMGQHNVEFTVEPDGSVSNINVIQVGLPTETGTVVSQALAAAIDTMPRMLPARRDGMLVRYRAAETWEFNLEHSVPSSSVVYTPKEGADDNVQMPSFPGGPKALFDFIAKNLRYPSKAEKYNLQGRVVVSFVLDEDGSISEITVVNSVHPLLDNEAKRVIGLMPRWNPGILDGKPVRVKYSVPVTFKMR